MSASVRRSPLQLWLIAALCVMPVAASYLAYYLMTPTGRTNYGELLETTPLPRAHLKLTDGSPFELESLRGKWLLLMVDSGDCNDFCRRKLFNMRQLRLTQGKNMERIERVWLIADNITPSAATVGDYAGTWLARAAGSVLLQRLPALHDLTDYLYVVD